MKLRWFAVLLGLALSTAVAARAQVGIYVAPTAARVKVSFADTGPFAYLGDNNTSSTFKGANFGAYYDFAGSGALKYGIDMRDLIVGGANGARDNSFFVGLRAVYNGIPRVRPYVEAMAGVAGTHSGLNPRWLRRGAYGAAVGADYRLGNHVDWRVLEIGYSSYQPVNSQAFGELGPQPNASSITFSSGLVFRFGK